MSINTPPQDRSLGQRPPKRSIDPVVLTNPFLDHAEVIELGKPLPYPDNNFDIVSARSAFEHIEDPEWLAWESLRIVKPAGSIAPSTRTVSSPRCGRREYGWAE